MKPFGRRLGRAFALAVAASMLGGCGHRSRDDDGQAGARASKAAPAVPARRPSPYGPDGVLKESKTAVAGLRLPVALDHVYDRERKHAYRSTLPVTDFIRYFGPKLLTGEVDRIGQGAVYRHAVPKGVRGGVVKLDVSILSAATGTRVEIVEIRPPPAHPPDVEAIQKALAQQRFSE